MNNNLDSIKINTLRLLFLCGCGAKFRFKKKKLNNLLIYCNARFKTNPADEIYHQPEHIFTKAQKIK